MATKRKKPEELLKRGRPTIYTQELADLICQRVATNTCGLHRLCEKYDDLPDKTTINEWRYLKPNFSIQYAQAKLKQADLLAEDVLELAESRPYQIDKEGNRYIDSGEANMIRTQIDTQKWLAAKLLPKQYGKAAEEVPSENKDSVIDKLIEKLADK